MVELITAAYCLPVWHRGRWTVRGRVVVQRFLPPRWFDYPWPIVWIAQ